MVLSCEWIKEKMIYRIKYNSPKDFDDIWLEADDGCLTGLWFEGSKDNPGRKHAYLEKSAPVLEEAKTWLDVYFSGREPDFTPKYRLDGLTPFQKEVYEILNTIPFGKTMTYKEIAKIIADQRNVLKMSSQAIGKAIGLNPICIIIPCHRVIGSDDSLKGYSGGIQNKAEPLRLEKEAMMSSIGRKEKLS